MRQGVRACGDACVACVRFLFVLALVEQWYWIDGDDMPDRYIAVTYRPVFVLDCATVGR